MMADTIIARAESLSQSETSIELVRDAVGQMLPSPQRIDGVRPEKRTSRKQPFLIQRPNRRGPKSAFQDQSPSRDVGLGKRQSSAPPKIPPEGNGSSNPD